jgi:hypothetical protein
VDVDKFSTGSNIIDIYAKMKKIIIVIIIILLLLLSNDMKKEILGDTDADGCISRSELGLVITSWLMGSVTRSELGQTITSWLSGCASFSFNLNNPIMN